MKADIFSVYMDNIEDVVARAQEECVKAKLPEDYTFRQLKFPYQRGAPHANALHDALSYATNDIVIFIDVDCIPLTFESFDVLATCASRDELVGFAYRANHLSNGGHIFVGPGGMAFSLDLYRKLGSPSFVQTDRGDTAEELTYCWEKHNLPVRFLWPSKVRHPVWPLKDGKMFGPGTIYENLFYHEFQIREAQSQQRFIDTCKFLLE